VRRFKTALAAFFETAASRIQNFPMRRALKKFSIFSWPIATRGDAAQYVSYRAEGPAARKL
jgi:hypothetical protein